MSIGTILSRLTGFVRQWAMAISLGVTIASTGPVPIASAFTIANNIPNMVYELVVGGILSSMFIPIFLERLNRDGESEAFSFTNTLFTLTLLLLGIIAVVGTLFPEPFIRSQTFTIDIEETRLAIYLFRFFAVQIVFYAFGALTTGLLNSYHRFFAPGVAPMFNNLVVIVALLGFYMPFRESRPDLAIVALGVGTTLGVITMFLVQVVPLLRIGFRFRLSLDLKDPSLRKMLRKTAPVIGYVVVNIVGISFRNAFATQTMRDGSAVLSYAWMWYQLPFGVLAVSYISTVFPELSRRAAAVDWTSFKNLFSSGLRVMALLMMPSAAILLALGTPLVTLYRFGRFPADAIPLVTAVLAAWTLGLFFFASYMLTLRAFYAMQDTWTPMVTNFFLTAVQVGLYALLTKVIDGPFALVGIPAADAVFFLLHTIVLLIILHRRIGPFGFRHVLGGWLRAFSGATAGGLSAAAVVFATAGIGSTASGNLARIALGGAVGLGVSYAALRHVGVGEMSYVDGLLRRVGSRLTRRNGA